MGFNLTNERIQDTYPQLLQISGSTIVDGTGSVAPILITSASYAVTASFALNAGDIDTSSLTPLTTFNAYTSSNDSRVDSLTAATSSYLTSADITGKLDTSTFNSYTSSNDSKVDALIAATSSYLTSLPSGVISSSAQIADDISGSFTSTSASLAADIATNKVDISTNTSNISTQTSRVDSLVSATSSYAVKAENNTFSGLQTFNNIAVNGTASIGYLQSVTGSAKVIGDAYIILNNDTPAQRYAGVKVFDSGSTNNSASFEFDGQTNDWFYEYTDDGGATEEFGVVMFGPGYNTRGSHVYPSNNTILKGTGDHHLVDSSITDDGSTITFGNPVNAGNITLTGTTSKLELTGIASQIKANNITGSWGQTNASGLALSINGNIRASGNLEGANAQSLSGNRRVAIGNNNNVTSDDSVAIGGEANSIGASYSGIFSAASSTISSGDTSTIIGGYQNTINGGRRNAIIGGESVTNGQNFAIVLGRESFTAPNAYTTYTANLDVSGSIVVSGSGITFSDGTTQTTAAGAAGLVSGTGTDSIQSSADLTTTPATASNLESIAIGDGASATGEYSISIGSDSTATGNESISIGKTSGRGVGPDFRSIAIGSDVYANGSYSVIIGSSTETEANFTTIIGYDAAGGGNVGSTALGYQALSRGQYSTAVGAASRADGQQAIAIGYSNTADYTNNIIIGNSINTTDNNEINIGNIFTYNSASNGEVSLKSNLETTGQIYSPTHVGTVASSTSSIDFDNGNFATLSLTTPTFLANPSNLKSGTTYTLIIDSGSLISNHGTAWKFAGGTSPTYSNGTDVLTCVSDGTNLYATALTDFQ